MTSSGTVQSYRSPLAWRGNYWHRYASDPADIGGAMLGYAWFKGRLYAVSSEYELAGSSVARVLRYRVDLGRWESVDGPFGSGGHTLNGAFAITVWNGKLIVGGVPGGATTDAVWSYDGNESFSWTAMPLPYPGTIYSLCEYFGELFAGGLIGSGGTYYGVVRRATGAGSWSVPNGGLTRPGNVPYVFAMCVHDGDLIAAGSFTKCNGSATDALNITRWDGATWHPLGAGLVGSLYAVCSYPTDNGLLLYAGGAAMTIGNILAVWTNTTWLPAGTPLKRLSTTLPLAVRSLTIFRGELIVAGHFHAYDALIGQSPLRHLARYDAVANQLVAVGDLDGSPLAIVPWAGGLAIGGLFGTADGRAAPYLTHLVGGAFSRLGDGYPTGPVYSLADAGDLFAGGEFLWVGETSAERIARLNDALWSAVGSFDGPVHKILYDSVNDQLHFLGEFIRGGGQLSPRWVVLNLSTMTWTKPSTEDFLEDELIRDAVIVDGIMFVVGMFSEINGVACNNCARIDLDTLVVTAMGDGVRGELHTVCAYDGQIAVGGWFDRVDGANTDQKIALWDDTEEEWTIAEVMVSYAGPVYALCSWDDDGTETLLAGVYGKVSFGDQRSRYLLRALPAGGSWATLAEELNGAIRVIALDAAGEPYIGGDFDQYGDVDQITRWAMCLLAYRDGMYRRLGGGVGTIPDIGPLQLDSGEIANVTVVPRHDDADREQLMIGSNAPGSQLYSPGVAALTLRGWRPLQGGLYGGGAVLARGAYAFLREGTSGAAYIGGNFAGGLNELIAPADQATVTAVVVCAGVIHWDGRYFRSLGASFPGLCRELVRFGEALIGLDWFGGPYAYTADPPAWDLLAAAYLGGDHRTAAVFDDLLWVFGQYEVDVDGMVTATTWDGAAVADVSPEGITTLKAAAVGDIGSGDQLIVCGDNLPGYHCVRVRVGATWVDVGSGVYGEPTALAVVDFGGPIGPRLFVSGGLIVGEANCLLAMWDGADWTPIIDSPLLGQITDLRGPSEAWLPRLLTICADAAGLHDIANDRDVEINGVGHYHPDTGLIGDQHGGINGAAIGMG